MVGIYRVFKAVLIIMLLSIVGLIIYLEVTKTNWTKNNDNEILKWSGDTYLVFKDFLFDDPYQKNVLSKVNSAQSTFRGGFYSMADGLSNLTSRKEFYNSIFIYMVSKKMDGMDALIKEEFGENPAFKDFIIIDKDRNILYKYGESSFTADFYPLSNTIEPLFIDDTLGIVQKYSDPTMDYQLEIITLFNREGLLKQLKEISFPAFLALNGKMYQNSPALPNILEKVQSELRNERQFYLGMNVVETYVININKTYIATLGISFPARSLGSNLLIMLKILFFFFILFILILVDRVIEKKLLNMEVWKKTIRIEPQKKKTDSVVEQQEEKEEDQRLSWIEHYIEDAEGKKK